VILSPLLTQSVQWPYSYDECDVGTLANQTLNGLPVAATTTGEGKWNGTLSFLPGQRLSRCTCKGQSTCHDDFAIHDNGDGLTYLCS
jgi:beta-glucanase (GH16 family)